MSKIFLDVNKIMRDRKTRIGPTVALGDGLSSLYYCWVRRLGPAGYAEHFEVDDPEKYLLANWKEKTEYLDFELMKFHKPADVWTVSLRSRQVFQNGLMEFMGPLPAPVEGRPTVLIFGFEADDAFHGGVAHWSYDTGTGKLFATVGRFYNTAPFMDLTEYLPADYTTAIHNYSVIVQKHMVLYYIDGMLRGIVVILHGDGPYTGWIWHGGTAPTARYKIMFMQQAPPQAMSTILDMDMGGEFTWEGAHPWWIRVMEHAEGALYTPLFVWDTGAILRNYTLTAGQVLTSPIVGVGDKTIMFLANQGGTLNVDAMVHAGADLEPVYAIIESLTVTADRVLLIKPQGDAYAYRLWYNPTAYPATINSTLAIVK